MMLSYQYGPESLRNVSSTFLNLCHKELSLSWKQKVIQPAAIKVYLQSGWCVCMTMAFSYVIHISAAIMCLSQDTSLGDLNIRIFFFCSKYSNHIATYSQYQKRTRYILCSELRNWCVQTQSRNIRQILIFLSMTDSKNSIKKTCKIPETNNTTNCMWMHVEEVLSQTEHQIAIPTIR